MLPSTCSLGIIRLGAVNISWFNSCHTTSPSFCRCHVERNSCAAVYRVEKHKQHGVFQYSLAKSTAVASGYLLLFSFSVKCWPIIIDRAVWHTHIVFLCGWQCSV